MQVLANILSTQPSGRLYKGLVETKKAASASAYAGAEHDPGLFMVDAEVPRGNSPDEVRDLAIGIVEKVGAQGVTAEEVNRAKQQILKARELASTETSQIAIRLSEWASQGDWRLYFLHRDRIEKVTPEAVRAAATCYLQRNNRTVGMFVPTDKPERVDVPPAPNLQTLLANYQGRATMAEGEAFDPTPANVEARVKRQELPEGIKVTVTDGTKLKVEGADKQLVGAVTAEIRGYYPPEPYKGKGVRIVGERVRRKEGKTVA